MSEQVGEVTVVVVDDHPLFRAGLRGLLETEPGIRVVGEAGTASEAVRLATTERPDVVLMDLNLPGTGGIEATRSVVRVSPATAVLVVTMVDDDGAVHAALRAGARGYLLKGSDGDALLAGVRAVAAGGAVFGPGTAARLLQALTGPPPAPVPAADGLTGREQEVLALLADGLDNARIARELGVSVKTVQNHVSRVLVKLQARDRVEAVLRVRGRRP